MNCNKKSHFDGMTPVHRQGGGVEGFGYVSVCNEEVLSQASKKEKGGKLKQERNGKGSKKLGRRRKRCFLEEEVLKR